MAATSCSGTEATAASKRSPKRPASAASGWFTDAVWFDYDNDSHLDLFVSGFVSYSLDEAKYCGDNEAGRRHYCIPRSFRPSACLLFRNKGDGTFADVSEGAGIASVGSKSFGAVATDINRDGALDLFVANDTIQNFLFVNQGDGTFYEEGLLLGVAYSDAGTARSGMGVDAADYDGDGWQDLFVANIDQEMFSLYKNLEGADFVDASLEVRRETRLYSGWGLRFFDFDNDGDPDLILANGHPDDMIGLFKPQVSYRQELLLFENRGREFENVSSTAGRVFEQEFAARGLAVGDYDNDGDGDVLVSNNGAAPLLLRNDTEPAQPVGRPAPDRDRKQPGGSRCRDCLEGGQYRAQPFPHQRRQLPVLARPARDPRPGERCFRRMDRGPLAQRHGRSP